MKNFLVLSMVLLMPASAIALDWQELSQKEQEVLSRHKNIWTTFEEDKQKA